MGFDFCCYGGEENETEYIKKFKEMYSNGINIPEGKLIVFKFVPDTEITHTWRGGKQGNFKKFRAQRICWIKEILEKKEIRSIKYNTKNQNIYFILNKKVGQWYWAVRCIIEKNSKRIRFLTSFPLTPAQKNKYSKWPEYFFDKQKSC